MHKKHLTKKNPFMLYAARKLGTEEILLNLYILIISFILIFYTLKAC